MTTVTHSTTADERPIHDARLDGDLIACRGCGTEWAPMGDTLHCPLCGTETPVEPTAKLAKS